jgi:DNA-binding LacI/PurR family transcriptional regulator
LIRFAADGWSDGVDQALALLAEPDPPERDRLGQLDAEPQVLAAGQAPRPSRFPVTVSVVGYDDSPWDPLLDPPLTTVATPLAP